MGDFHNFLKRICTQTAVYWERTGSNGKGGALYADPIEIRCRWSDEEEIITADRGRELVSNSQIMVLQDLADHSMVKLCTLNDLDSDELDDPGKAKARRILKFKKIPSIDGKDYIRRALL
jgi:hypothetical protein